MAKKLVIGASGFIGSNVTRKLVERGEDVRVMLRKTSSTQGIDDLDIEKCYGDVWDGEALRDAMAGCDVVFYCVVDARAWLRDPTPLIRTNVEGLRNVLDVAVDADLDKFVFMSTIATLGVRTDGTAVNEEDPCNWYGEGGPYTRSRVDAERLVLKYAQDKGLPAVALCISTPYGPRDWQPTPHGGLLARIAAGKAPFYFAGLEHEVVGVDDAAEAMVLAMTHGRDGERYIISDTYMTSKDLHTLATSAGGKRAPWLGLPAKLMLGVAAVNQVIGTVIRRDLVFVSRTFRMWNYMSELDHSKAERELGWKTTPFEDSVTGAVDFYRTHNMM